MDILILSKRIFLGDGNNFIDGGILISNDGIIRQIFTVPAEVNSYLYNYESEQVFDFGNKIIMSGLIDPHVHINEPGRKDWEGFVTATKAAAAGGFTTIVDMPSNSIPPTTSINNLRNKVLTAKGKIYVDVAFWGGIVPDNLEDLDALLQCGVVGLKCFLCPSGIPEFSHVNKEQIEEAIHKMQSFNSVLAFHAEEMPSKNLVPDESQSKKYETFLNTRPSSMEVNAVQTIVDLSQKYNYRMHIGSLSSAEAIPIIQNCRQNGGNLTVETCHHYLSLAAEDVPDARTEFKCCPPIRDKSNRENLWKAVVNKDIDLVVSAHSPTTAGMKCLIYGRGRGDFIKAWSGIASHRFGLSLLWTNCEKYGLTLEDIYRLMCLNPAKLCGFDKFKGKIAVGYHADFCIWDPDEEFTVSPEMIYFQNKANPYMNQKLKGVVHATIVRGFHVYQQHESFGQPLGRVILRGDTRILAKLQ